MSTDVKLVIDCQGEERIETVKLPDGREQEIRYFVPLERYVPLTDEEIKQREIDAAAPAPLPPPPAPADVVLGALTKLPEKATAAQILAAIRGALEKAGAKPIDPDSIATLQDVS
jgi:hypothetical protein